MYTFEERYNFYTNNLFNNKTSLNFNISKNYLNRYQNSPYLYEVNDINFNKDTKKYIVEILNDGYNNPGFPCFHKAKLANENNFAILSLKTYYYRHWNLKNKDKHEWNDKIPDIFWRGATTGYNHAINRYTFMQMYFNKYNIGFINTFYWNHEKVKNYVKKSVDYDEYTKYKYLISIEGNDKDSGLNWKLNSNSLVIMRKPFIISWLMESKLEPYVHYVPLKDDFSDLDEIYQWCLDNDDKCKEIVKNANKFMDNFKDIELENKLENTIYKDYLKYVNFKLLDN
jgi:hypothetical protein